MFFNDVSAQTLMLKNSKIINKPHEFFENFYLRFMICYVLYSQHYKGLIKKCSGPSNLIIMF